MLEKTQFLCLEKNEGKGYHKITFKNERDLFSWTLSTLPMKTQSTANEPLHTEHPTHGMGDARTTEALPMSNSRSCGFRAREMQLGFRNSNRKPAHTPASVLMTKDGERSQQCLIRGKP